MSNAAITIKVEAPDLVAALMRLAAAVNPSPSIPVSDAPGGQMPTPASITPSTAPVPLANPVSPQIPANETPVQMAMPAPAAPLAGPTYVCHSNSVPAPTAVPLAGAPAYTLEQISKAGVALVDAGKMGPLQALLTKYGVKVINQLQPGQYGVFATELRALGAQI